MLYPISKIYSHLTEPNILKRFTKYDFLPKIISSFHDYDNIYLITTYFEGKTLISLKRKKMTEEQIKFISACTIQSFIYMRKEKIIHRDITFNNIIMDKNKYFNVIDFSCSIYYLHKDNKKIFLKTYKKVTPPEMLNMLKYYYNSDYYRLGSIIYYLIFKKYPNIVKLEKNITNIEVNYTEVKNYSQNFIDFLNKLIISVPEKRIGFKDINELKNHPWFIGYDWNNLEKKKMKSPFKLIENNNFSGLCIKSSISNRSLMKYKSNSKKNNYKILMKKYDYVNKRIFK
jgi:serine/threonine protein kinase